MFAVSCVIPFPVRYYEPLNEGEKIADPSVIGLEYILLFVISIFSIYFTKIIIMYLDKEDENEVNKQHKDMLEHIIIVKDINYSIII